MKAYENQYLENVKYPEPNYEQRKYLKLQSFYFQAILLYLLHIFPQWYAIFELCGNLVLWQTLQKLNLSAAESFSSSQI